MRDLITRAKHHQWWYSDQNLALQLIDRLEELEQANQRLLDERNAFAGWAEQLRRQLQESRDDE